MRLFPDVPGHEFEVMKIPPRPGMKGRVHYTNHTSPGIPPEGTQVEVIALGEGVKPTAVSHLRVRATDGTECELGHSDIDCGHVMMLAGQWRAMDDPLVVEWERSRGIP